MLFLENEAQIDQNNYGTMLFMSKQVSLPKISSILPKNQAWVVVFLDTQANLLSSYQFPWGAKWCEVYMK